MSVVTTPIPAPGVRLDRDGPVARVTLDRPESHNALQATDVRTLLSIFESLRTDAALRVLVVTGAGEETFSAGASLPQMQSGEMSGEIFDTLTGALADVPVPTICALNGSVYGGGAEFALCCDFRVGHDEIRLSVPAARLGVCYPIGGITRYVQRLGLAAASRILLAAEEMEGRELHRIGYLTHCVGRTELAAEVDALVGRLTSLAPLAVRAMKELLLAAAAGSPDPDRARALVRRCADSADFAEGMAAWNERRDPRFNGT